MKLIDADKLPIKYDGHTVSVWKNDIDAAPTVNAIPIEWIREFSKKQKRGNYKDFINFMITYWEKEDEY